MELIARLGEGIWKLLRLCVFVAPSEGKSRLLLGRIFSGFIPDFAAGSSAGAGRSLEGGVDSTPQGAGPHLPSRGALDGAAGMKGSGELSSPMTFSSLTPLSPSVCKAPFFPGL